ncbi:aminoacyl-histidine dipeptidase [Plesiomonas sp.]|uniref:aminoacyl-histidine dipeptidase n=1 Tax=Plesiomonas sp. TaxID=2486279 RepID=UPI003F36B052
MSQLGHLSPQPLWQFFEKICSIPHPSHHEEALASFIVEWAQGAGLHVERDAVGNILIRKPATAGMENRKPVVLQAHLDMVPQKNNDTVHDFIKDPIRPYIDGEWVKAQGTTLGADNGIGMASALAVVAANDLQHGPLEVLLTIDEESGMTGAFGLQSGWLQGEILINTDSEEEGEIYMGCAGGIDATMTLPVARETAPADMQAFTLTVKGLKGGHSGGDIHLYLGNANKMLGRFLFGHAAELGLRLANIQGGTLRNAIPREGSATLLVPTANVARLRALVDKFTDIQRSELSAVEPNLTVLLDNAPMPAQVFAADAQQRLLALLHACPNGVMRMSDVVPGVVETSLNLGVVTTSEQGVQIVCLIRSLIDSGRCGVQNMLSALAELAGAEAVFKGGYPGWKPDNQSPIMQVVRETYQAMFDKTPNIMVIHAGLECGLFKEPYPQMDMVSVGPTIRGPHSPDERVHIDSVDKYWQLLTQLLKNIPERA